MFLAAESCKAGSCPHYSVHNPCFSGSGEVIVGYLKGCYCSRIIAPDTRVNNRQGFISISCINVSTEQSKPRAFLKPSIKLAPQCVSPWWENISSRRTETRYFRSVIWECFLIFSALNGRGQNQVAEQVLVKQVRRELGGSQFPAGAQVR